MGDAKRRKQMGAHSKRAPLAKVWLIPQDSQIQVMVFDAIAANGKRFTIGEGIGRIEPSGIRLTEISQTVIDRLAMYTRVENASIQMVELANEDRISRRICEVFANAPDGSAIMFICHTPEIIDGLLPFLKIQKGHLGVLR